MKEFLSKKIHRVRRCLLNVRAHSAAHGVCSFIVSVALVASLVPSVAFSQEILPGFSRASLNSQETYAFAESDSATSSAQPLCVWDVSAGFDGSVSALLIENATSEHQSAQVSYTLRFQGTGAVRDFSSDVDLPYKTFANYIQNIEVEDGISSLGSYSCALPYAASVRGGNTLASLSKNAFYQASSIIEFDFSFCSLLSVSSEVFGPQSQDISAFSKRTVYVCDSASALNVQTAAQNFSSITAVAVLNGGHLLSEHQAEAGVLATPVKQAYTFVTWTSDEYLKHPCSAWEPLSKYILYARFVEIDEVVDPEPYTGNQGLDQTITVYDPSKLPAQAVNSDILFLGEDSNSYRNQFQTAFDGYQTIEFAFGMGRGTNANGGDGSYQLSFSLPYVSILDNAGNTVAEYENGNGLLQLAGIVFDGKMNQETGYNITAIRLSLARKSLPEGTYTLRFGREIGANNGMSILGKDADFSFEVVYPTQYELSYSYDETTQEASVTGVKVLTTTALDVVVPQTVVGPNNKEYQVTALASEAFAGQNLITSIDVSLSVTSIGNEAFAHMPLLERVTVRAQGNESLPAWGARAFADTSTCTLYGYRSSSCSRVAHDYENVSFVALDEGIYVNGNAVNEQDCLVLSPDTPQAVVTIMENGEETTNKYRGYITNTRVITHTNTTSLYWNTIQAAANGSAQLKIVSSSGNVRCVIPIVVQRFSEEASSEQTELSTYQGNGCTVRLLNAGTVTTVDYDETLECFTNTIKNPVSAATATFTLDISGPGSAWGPTHSGWNWAGFVKNIEENLYIEDQEGNVVATFGSGLTWRTLTSSNSVVVSVDQGVLELGKTYYLIAGEGFSGHNAQATLMKAVSWAFTAGKTDISDLEIGAIEPQEFQNQASEPHVSVYLPAYARLLWDNENSCVITEQVDAQALVCDTDYSVSYENNVQPGRARALVCGKGLFEGTACKEFVVYGKGDVNMNGVLNIVDAQIAYDIAHNLYADDPNITTLKKNADVVGSDGVVDAVDAFAIQHAALCGW